MVKNLISSAVPGIALAVFGVAMSATPAAAQQMAASHQMQEATFHADIEPILQRSCQRCHNPNSVAPMSLLTYEQVRPYARAIKQRTALARAPWSRGAMPPWFLEKDIGIQHVKDDVSLSDEEIDMIGAWADAGAPRGNPADAPPPIELAAAGEWTLGEPDLIVTSPVVFVDALGSDWGGDFGKTPIGLLEDRYASSAEFIERRLIVGEAAGKDATIGGRFVFHHANVGVQREDRLGGPPSLEDDRPEPSRLPIHEVGRNGDVFPEDAGKLLPADGFIAWNSMHIHPTGTPGSESYARLDIGFKLHPKGYEAERDIQPYTFGRTQLQIDPLSTNQRVDAYYVAPQAMKLVNYEPHMHANGVRMCLQAVYGRYVETLNCSGYDHNWVRNFYYEENYEPLIPKGTILHAISWFDNSPSNENLIDARNLSTFGNSSVNNMFIVFNLAEFLTDEEYLEEVRERKEFLALTGEEPIGCPGCRLTLPDRTPQAADADGQPAEGGAAASSD